MKQGSRIATMAGALALAFLLGGASVARGEHERKQRKSFSGTFRGPHGQFSINIGSPGYSAGSYAPYGYPVYRRPSYGYGFESPAFDCRPHRLRHSHWVPVRRYRSRWIVEPRYASYDRHYGDPYSGAGYDDPYSDDGYRGGRRHACWDACPVHHPVASHDCFDGCPIHHAAAAHVHSEDCGHDWDDDDD